jgi:prefoldin beta subunit
VPHTCRYIMTEQMQQLQKLHEAQSNEMKKVQEQMGKLAENMSQYYQQKLENDMVLKELKLLSDDSTVFKRVGPCLIKQDMFEATSNVEKRIDYITQELTRIEGQKKNLEDKRNKLQKALVKTQEDVQHIVKSMEAAAGAND